MLVRTDVVAKYANIIKEFCSHTNCEYCIFHDKHSDNECMLFKQNPSQWNITTDKSWNFGNCSKCGLSTYVLIDTVRLNNSLVRYIYKCKSCGDILGMNIGLDKEKNDEDRD